MGLGQVCNGNREASVRRIAFWCVPAILVTVSGVVAIFGEPARRLLRFERGAILDVEVWRLLSGHFVHLSALHYAVNAMGLILVWLLVGAHCGARQWVAIIAVSILGIDLGLWFGDAGIDWYVGLSGLLHAMLAAGIVIGLRSVPVEASLVALVMTAKIVFEQWHGPLPGSERTAGGTVLVDAHLYGALAGAGVAAIMRGASMRQKNGE